jgi:hypothetical protein
MTLPDLPEDPSDWPDDPFAILGLDRTAAAIEIKRAYTRLIKKYRPEQYPEEFRRIREAYDSCTAASRWILDAGFDSAPTPASESTLPPLASVATDEAVELWSLAESDPAAAYKGLAQLAEREPERADLPLRLYWLLSLDADLDSWRTRHDWLAMALRRSRLAGPAAELYRRELRTDPETALDSKSFIGILGANASPFDKLIVAQHRLSAAGRSHTWSPLSDDIAELAQSLPMANEEAWLSYLATAHEWAAWDRPNPLYGQIRDELKKMEHLELPQAHVFDRIENTRNVSKGWANRASVLLSGAWMRLVPLAWADGVAEREEVRRAVQEVNETQPLAALNSFDRLNQEFGPYVAFALFRMLDRVLASRNTHDAPFPPDAIRAIATRLPRGWNRDYESLRPDLVEFLTLHCIHPDELIAACELDPVQKVRMHMITLRGDLSLKLVWLARTLAE